MTDAELGKLVNAAFEEAGFGETVRGRLREAVVAVIGDGATSAQLRASRVAADELEGLLVARKRSSRSYAPRPSAVTTAEDVKQKAFRVMAGVRV